MRKLWAVVLLVLLVMLLMPLAILPAFAAEKAVDAGNKLCPISGEPVSGTSFVEYHGKRYGLCCPGCAKMFLANPEKHIAEMEAKEKASAPVATPAPAVSQSKQMEKDMEQGSL
jgi:YHS domain-containing protein